jgi:hypothetical protein
VIWIGIFIGVTLTIIAFVMIERFMEPYQVCCSDCGRHFNYRDQGVYCPHEFLEKS